MPKAPGLWKFCPTAAHDEPPPQAHYRVAVLNVRDLMAYYHGQGVFVRDFFQQAAKHDDVPAEGGEGIDGVVVDVMHRDSHVLRQVLRGGQPRGEFLQIGGGGIVMIGLGGVLPGEADLDAERDLARKKYEIPGLDGLGVRSYRFGRAW